MSKKEIISNTAQMVRLQLEGEGSGHDWHHIERVWKQASILAEMEGADSYVVQLAALVHDLADDKVVENEEEGLQRIQYFLDGEGVTENVTQHILEIVQSMSFSKGKTMRTLEGKVVQDADRLDAIGAVGIARAFTYAGSKGRPIFDPDFEIREDMSREEYRNGDSSTIHHFYEKLLKLKDLMNTEAAIELAEERHAFMEEFLAQFYKEIGRDGLEG